MFSDIDNHWSKKCIIELRDRNLVSGYPDGTFRPNAPVTRAEFAVFMGNIFRYASPVQNPISFTDVPKNYWAYKDIQSASSKGFLAGYPDKTFKPEQLIPRVQALIALAAQLKLKVPENAAQMLPEYFDDSAEIPQYARNLLAAATRGFLVVNYPNFRQLKPNKSATRGEVAAFFCKALRIGNAVPPQYIPRTKWFAIAPQFDEAMPFKEGLALVGIQETFGQKWGFIDKTGSFKIGPEFVYGEGFSEELAAVRVSERWGFIDKTGKFAIQPQFYVAQSFSEGLAAVFAEGSVELKWGFIDKTGKIAIAPQFDSTQKFSEGLAPVAIEQKWGFIDKTGSFKIAPEFIYAEGFSEELAAVFTEGNIGKKWGFIDKTGKLVIAPQFDSPSAFFQGFAQVKLGDKQGFIDKTGNFFNELPLKNSEGNKELKPSQVGEQWGYIDPYKKLIIPVQFDEARQFSEGLAAVRIGAEWVWEGRGNDGQGSYGDYIRVLTGGKWGYIFNPLS